MFGVVLLLSRDITAVTFSEDRELVYCATSSGDFLLCSVKTKHIGRAVPVCRLGARSLLSWHEVSIGHNILK
jgi:hypothetical protein